MSLGLSGDGVISGFDAVASGFGGLVAVRHVLKTDTFTASLAAGVSALVDDLEITHAMSDANNRLIVYGNLGLVGAEFLQVGVGLAVDGTLVNVGDTAASTTPVGSSAWAVATLSGAAVSTSFAYVLNPGNTTSANYSIRVINTREDTRSVFVNRPQSTSGLPPRSSSSLVLMEVAV